MLEPAVGISTVYSRSKRMAPSNTNPDNSLEARAFAEGAILTGQKYPSRSFLCSFCRREFLTAQALGGHMNVHRRERALASQLLQLRNHGNELEAPSSNNPPVTRDPQDVITQACNMRGDFCAGSSSSSSSPPSQESISFANSVVCSVRNLPRLDSVDLELRLGQTPEL